MRSHGYDLDEMADRAEIVRTAGIERQAGSARGRCKEEIDGTRPPCLASCGYHSGINPPGGREGGAEGGARHFVSAGRGEAARVVAHSSEAGPPGRKIAVSLRKADRPQLLYRPIGATLSP
jgi:hypothetical protein